MRLMQGIHVRVSNIDDGAVATVAVQRQAPKSDVGARRFAIKRYGSM